MTSEQLASSVGTNASYIRRLTGQLKRACIIQSHQGVGGFKLTENAETLTLLQVYQAVCETEQVHIFDLHRNPNDRCVVGRWIQPVLQEQFRHTEALVEQELQRQTLADVIGRLKETSQ